MLADRNDDLAQDTDAHAPGPADPGAPDPYGDDAAPDAPEGVALGALPSLLGYVLRRAQLAVFQDFYRSCAALDIRPAQYSVLTVLRHNPGVQQSRVADALGIKRANFVTLFATLEARTLVRRERVPTDRRAFALFLTAAGETLLDEVDVCVAKHDAGFIERIGADNQQRLLEWLDLLATRPRP